jgi:hypothetical protein
MTTYYALINKQTNEVVQIIPGVDENTIQIDTDGTEVGGNATTWERFYESRPWNEGLICKKTNLDNNNVGIGYTYDQSFGVFVEPKPFVSWKFNYTTLKWEAPVAMPESIEGYQWIWSEPNKEWIQVAIPSA